MLWGSQFASIEDVYNAYRLARENTVKSMALCVALLVILGTVRSAGAITLDATDRGQYQPAGDHNPSNLNYLAGDCRSPIQQGGNCVAGSDDFRNFFVFDLSGLTDLITAATLRLNNPDENGFITDAASETYMLYDVTTAIASLIDGTAGVGAWSDLGSGTEFGVHVATAVDNEMFVEIDLNPAAVAALNTASGLFAFGGAITTLNGVADEETLFAFTTFFGPLNDTQLELTLVPEPSTLVLLAFALGLLWIARVRQLAAHAPRTRSTSSARRIERALRRVIKE